MVGESTDPCRKLTMEGRSATPSPGSQCRPPLQPAYHRISFTLIIFTDFKLRQLPPHLPSLFSLSLTLSQILKEIASVLKELLTASSVSCRKLFVN